MRHAIKSRRRERGASLVEFSLVLLPTLGFLLMTMDVAWVIFAWASIQEAAREGVRSAVATQAPNETSLDSSTKTIVQQFSFGFVNAGNVNTVVIIHYYDPNTLALLDGTSNAIASGNVVKVTISNLRIGTFGPIFRTSTPIKLSASASDVLQ